MSRCYDIVCDECKVALWIGQRDYIYTGHPEVMKAFRAFLYEHENHKLRFIDDENLDSDYKEIDVDV